METASPTLTATLQAARKARRLSQLELSLRMGVSQRHVSFVESGRAKPSRDLLLTWLHELQAPLPVRNAALMQAGFAPAYSDATLDTPALAPATQALSQLLQAHDPQPALVLDADWNVLQLNRGALWLAQHVMPQALAAAQERGGPLNFLDALSHPGGPTHCMKNLREVGPQLLMHLREEAWVRPSLAPRVGAFASLLESRLGLHTPSPSTSHLAPALTSRFETVHGELALFSMFSTFGTPQNISLASLRLEHMFAADAPTREVLLREVPPAA